MNFKVGDLLIGRNAVYNSYRITGPGVVVKVVGEGPIPFNISVQILNSQEGPFYVAPEAFELYEGPPLIPPIPKKGLALLLYQTEQLEKSL